VQVSAPRRTCTCVCTYKYDSKGLQCFRNNFWHVNSATHILGLETRRMLAFVQVRVCIYMRVYTHMLTRICTCSYAHASAYTCKHLYAQARVLTHMYTVLACVCACMRTGVSLVDVFQVNVLKYLFHLLLQEVINKLS